MLKVYVSRMKNPKAGSRALLRHAQAQWGLPAAELEHDGAGKPVLPVGPEVSISHSAGAAAAALSDTAVGVDLEEPRPVRAGVPERVMGPEEYAWYVSRGRRMEDFLTLWTLKESYYKCLGTGLPGFPNQTCFIREGERWRLRGSELRFWTAEKDLLFLAVCGMEQEAEIIFL